MISRRVVNVSIAVLLCVAIAITLLSTVNACPGCGNTLGGPPPGGKYSTCCNRSDPEACNHEPVDPWFAENTCEYYEGITGITCETRRYFQLKAFEVMQKFENTPCPQIAFGSVIVNHTAGPNIQDAEILCEGPNEVFIRNHAYHAELTAFERCAEVLKQRFGEGAHVDQTLWQQLTLYTTGEPCPMDAQLFRWGKIGEIVYAVNMKDMQNAGWKQPALYIAEVQQRNNWCDLGGDMPEGAWGGTDGKTSFQTRLIRDVYRNELMPHFVWALNPAAPCPAGCKRDPNNAEMCIPNRVVPPPRPPRGGNN